jgi:hypothetical protein
MRLRDGPTGAAPCSPEEEGCQASKMERPSSRCGALQELCVRLGYCGGDRWLTASDLDGDKPDAVVDAVLAVEGLDPANVDPRQRTQIMALVEDWLFAPGGRGRRSGLPR